MDDEKDNEEPWREDRQKYIKRATRKHWSSEEKVWIVLERLWDDGSVTEPPTLCGSKLISWRAQISAWGLLSVKLFSS